MDEVDLATAMAFVQAGHTTHSDAEKAKMVEMTAMIAKAVADFRIAQGVDEDPNPPVTTEENTPVTSSWNS